MCMHVHGHQTTHLDPGGLAVQVQHEGSSPHAMLSALADSMKHLAPLCLSSPKLCFHTCIYNQLATMRSNSCMAGSMESVYIWS